MSDIVTALGLLATETTLAEILAALGLPVSEVTSTITAINSVDVFETAILNGEVFTLGFADSSGITAGTSYYYYCKNTSATKSLLVRPIDFNEGTLQILVIADGLFALDGVAYDPDDYIASPTYDAIKMPVRNANGNSANESIFSVWYQNALGTITWLDTPTNQILKRVASDMNKPKALPGAIRVVPPGTALMAILTNYGENKIPYKINVEWSEVVL